MNKLLLLRRWAMICSHIEVSENLIQSMQDLNDLISEIGTTKSGLPKRPDNVYMWFQAKSDVDKAKFIGKLGVINVNLGYAYESCFKLLLDLEEKEYQKSGKDGHNLPKLYSKLPEPVKQSICDLYRKVEQTDLEFEESFSRKTRSWKSSKQRRKPTFFKDLKHYHQSKYFQQSRYKYYEDDSDQSIPIIFPIRFSKLAKKIIDQVISPKLSRLF